MARPLSRQRRTALLATATASTLVVLVVGALTLQHAGSTQARADLTAWNGNTGNIWQGDVSTDWQVAGNWSQARAPIDGDAVEIPAVVNGADPVVITNIPDLDATTLYTFNVAATTAGQAAQRLTGAVDDTVIRTSFSMTLNGGVYTNLDFRPAGNTVLGTGAGGVSRFENSLLVTSDTGTFTVTGGFDVEGGTVSAQNGIVGATAVTGDGSVDVSGEVVNAFTVAPTIDLTLGQAPVTFDVAETLDAGTVDPATGFSTGGTVIESGGAVSFAAGVTNTGIVTLDGSGGAVTVNGASGAFTNAADGTLVSQAGPGGTATIAQAVANNGTLRLESGTLATGPFTSGASSTITTTIGSAGTTAGTSFGVLGVNGAATLAGTLDATFGTGVTPAAAATYPVVTYTSHTGAFSATGTGFGEGAYLAPAAPGATSAALVAHQTTVSVAAGTVNPGGSFSVTGSGFLPGETIDVVLGFSTGQSGDAVSQTTATASDTGAFSATLTVPATATPSGQNATYSVVAGGQASHSSVRTGATVTAKAAPAPPAPTPTTPAPAKDTDGDGLIDTMDCAPIDAARPLQGPGVTDADCNGVAETITRTGSDADDSFVGSGGPDTLIGGGGNDRIDGGSGNDRLEGGTGNDTLLGGVGGDVLLGGAGLDVLLGGAGNDVANGGAGNDRLDGAAGNDRLLGSLGNDSATGGAGNDVIDGGLGNDKVDGGVGNDKVGGGAGNDVLGGGSGNDALYAGGGRDVTSGGTGNDVINAVDGTGTDTITCGAGTDRVAADIGDTVAGDCERVVRHS